MRSFSERIQFGQITFVPKAKMSARLQINFILHVTIHREVILSRKQGIIGNVWDLRKAIIKENGWLREERGNWKIYLKKASKLLQ